MSEVAHYIVRLDEASSPVADRYVRRQFFTLRELPQAIWRMLFIREFVLCVLLPLSASIAGTVIAQVYPSSWIASALVWAGLAGLLLGVLWMSTLGKPMGIACFADGQGETLVGGLRIMVSRRRRRLWLVGAYIEPKHRAHGVFVALLLAAFRLAAGAAQQAQLPVELALFGPAHPASKWVMRKYVFGRRTLEAQREDESDFRSSLKQLEADLDRRQDVIFTFDMTPPSHSLWSGDTVERSVTSL